MARGSEAKARRKERRAEERAKAEDVNWNDFDAPVEEDTSGDDTGDDSLPMPPGQAQAAADAAAEAQAAAASDRKKSKKKKMQARKPVAPVKKDEGIKMRQHVQASVLPYLKPKADPTTSTTSDCDTWTSAKATTLFYGKE